MEEKSSNTTRNAIIVVGLIFLAISIIDPNFFLLRVLGTIQSVSMIILIWVAIAYLSKRI